MRKQLFFLLLFFSPSLLFAQQVTKQSKISAATLDAFEAEVRQEIQEQKIAGAAYLIYHQGKVQRLKAFGEADKASHKPMETNSLFRLASMTKPIATLALLLLQEDGLLNMNDRLDAYLPAFANPKVLVKQDTLLGVPILQTEAAKNPILLRHLLTHTAGFVSQWGGTLGGLYLATYPDVNANDLTHFSDQLAKLPLSHEPGEGWIYGPSINVTSRVVEVVSGIPFQDFVQQRILDPLGMKSTKFFLEESDAERLTTLYTPDGQAGLRVMDPGTVSSKLISGKKVFYSGSGGLVSTLEDYLTFCLMILNDGKHQGKQIAKPQTIALMKTDQVPLNINAHYFDEGGQLAEGFTFGYQVVRKETTKTLKRKGTIGWSGATGPIFFIDPKEELIGIYQFQTQPHSQVGTRKSFADWMIKATRSN
ncbi:MAG: beta-lactamase family protein [Algoriphagus sp.]|jgi:CubicO group peptidase (beta-lactamase class C family)|nr:beta-lactamase family protein [Algoriphagus sp.]MCE2778627.1 beta-lactamase family protein [Algoriphagus sp.]